MRKFFTLHSAVRYPNLYPIIVGILLTLVMVGCGGGTTTSGAAPSVSSTATSSTSSTLPHFDHIVVAIEENHAYSQIIGSSSAPYINSLASQGVSFTDSHGIRHPSEPNYLALFAGSTFDVASDACPVNVSAPDLGGELIAKGDTFTGYSESMPSVGFTDCTAGDRLYARKHNPWVNFSDVPANSNQPFTNFPTDFTKLPTVSFVIPNLQNDMHDGTIQQADDWLKANLDSYIQWAKAHNSLFILTWDEDNDTDVNQIPTIFVGAHVKTSQYGKTINHYNVLSTIENMYGLSYTHSASVGLVIGGIWQ